MKRDSFCRLFFVTTFLLMFFGLQTVYAWQGPPQCPPCSYWNGVKCVSYGDCSGGCPACESCVDCWCECTSQCCDNSDCGGCCKCSNCSCVSDNSGCSQANCEQCSNCGCQSKCDPETEVCCDGTCCACCGSSCCNGEEKVAILCACFTGDGDGWNECSVTKFYHNCQPGGCNCTDSSKQVWAMGTSYSSRDVDPGRTCNGVSYCGLTNVIGVDPIENIWCFVEYYGCD